MAVAVAVVVAVVFVEFWVRGEKRAERPRVNHTRVEVAQPKAKSRPTSTLEEREREREKERERERERVWRGEEEKEGTYHARASRRKGKEGEATTVLPRGSVSSRVAVCLSVCLHGAQRGRRRSERVG